MASLGYAHVIGYRFPGGRTAVHSWMNRLWGDATLAPDRLPYVHPVLAFNAALQGSGVLFDDIFNLMDANDGVLLGEQDFIFDGPLVIDTEYEVQGEVVDVVRKEGRRAGVFDIATFELRVNEAGASRPVAVIRTSLVFPRRDGVHGS